MKGLKRFVSVFAIAAMTVSLVGCGGGNSESSDEKVFRFGQSNPKVGLDMQTNSNSGASSVADNVVESLMRWNDDNEEECVLITDFPTVSEDGLTYSFELKEDVKFSDGTDLTAEDVKYTFERMFTPETGSVNTYMYDMIEGASEMLAGTATELSGIKIQDDYHFTIKLAYNIPPE